jgi:hypothetical protein
MTPAHTQGAAPASAPQLPIWSPIMTALVVTALAVSGALIVLQEPPPPPPDPNRYVGDGYAMRIPPAYEMERAPDLDSWLSSDGTRALRVFPVAVHEASDDDAALRLAGDEMVDLLEQLGLTFTDTPMPVTLPAGPAQKITLTVNDGQRLTCVALAERPRAWIFILMNFDEDVEDATLESIELNPAK